MEKCKKIIGILLLFFGVIGLLYPLTANIYDHFRQTKTIEEAKNNWHHLSNAQIKQEFQLAQTFNEQIHTASQGKAIDDKALRYKEVFKDYTLFAYLDVPSINIHEMPIYHGVEEETLMHGLGHLPGTSYPIGGNSTHAVVTGHSGLWGKTFFSNLEKMQKGDTFSITTLGKTVNYQVTEIQTISPNDVEKIRIQEGKDLASLLTCTPVTINSHRLLVTGTRTGDLPKTKEPSRVPWYTGPAVGGILAVAVTGGLIIGRKKKWYLFGLPFTLLLVFLRYRRLCTVTQDVANAETDEQLTLFVSSLDYKVKTNQILRIRQKGQAVQKAKLLAIQSQNGNFQAIGRKNEQVILHITKVKTEIRENAGVYGKKRGISDLFRKRKRKH